MSTLKDILYDARALLDEYNEDGIVIADDEVSTLETNLIRYINMAYQESYSSSRYFKEFNILNDRITNLLGDLTNFEIQQFTGDEINYPNNGVVGAKAYFFTADNDFSVRIEENNGVGWNALITLTETPTTLTDYKGIITPTDPSYPIRIVFSGTTFYRYQNVALYDILFKVDDIPDYKPWVRVDMPDDYVELEEVIAEYPVRQYEKSSTYKWEAHKTLVVNYFYDGSIKVIYKPRPDTLVNDTDVLQVPNPIALEFIKYSAAAKAAVNENPNVVNFFEQKANELKFEAFREQPASEEKITDVYFGGGFNGNI